MLAKDNWPSGHLAPAIVAVALVVLAFALYTEVVMPRAVQAAFDNGLRAGCERCAKSDPETLISEDRSW